MQPLGAALRRLMLVLEQQGRVFRECLKNAVNAVKPGLVPPWLRCPHHFGSFP